MGVPIRDRLENLSYGRNPFTSNKIEILFGWQNDVGGPR